MKIHLVLNISKNALTTTDLPWTIPVLEKLLPEVLASTCYNDSDLPFRIEVKNTETGHLFEHILLECLCQEKLSQGYKQVAFRGETSWNWKKENKGTFNITVEMKREDQALLPNALSRSINLFKLIVNNKLSATKHSQTINLSTPLPFSYQPTRS